MRIRLPGEVPPTYFDALEESTVEMLRPMMQALSIPKPQPTRKADIVQAIARRMEDDALLRVIWEQLDAQQQMAVRETVHDAGSSLDVTRFSAKHGGLPAGFARPRAYGGRNATVAASGMQLLFFPKYRDGPLRCVPADLAARLRELAAPPPPVALRTTDELPERISVRPFAVTDDSTEAVALTVRQMERAAAADLRAVLRLVGNGDVAVSAKTRRPTAATVRRIAQVLQGGDFYDALATKGDKWKQVPGGVRSFAWPWLLQAGRLAQMRGTRLELTRKGRAAMTQPAEVVLSDLWESWCETNLLDEFNRVDDIKGQLRGKGRRGMTSVAHRRDVIAEALCACPPDSWVEMDDFGLFMRAAALDFRVTDDPWHLYIGQSDYGSLGHEGSNDWEIIEGRYLRCLLFEYAATLGMVDVAFIPPENAQNDFRRMWGTDDLAYLSRYDGLMYFRLNSLGAYCLGLTEDYEPPAATERTALTIFPDRRVVLQGMPSAEECAVLETYANQEAEATWRLDGERILLALEAGGDVDELRGFLAARDDQPLPETVEGFLQRLSRGADAMKMRGEAFLIECADASVAEALMADSRIAKMCLRAGERHVVVRAKSERAFRNAARAMGFGLRE